MSRLHWSCASCLIAFGLPWLTTAKWILVYFRGELETKPIKKHDTSQSHKCGHKFKGHPVVDPLGMYDAQIGVHNRCLVLRRTLYDALGVVEVREAQKQPCEIHYRA